MFHAWVIYNNSIRYSQNRNKKKEKQTKFPPLLILLNNLLLLYTGKEQSLLFLSSHKFCDAVLHKMPIIFKVEPCIPDSKISFIRSSKFGLGSLLQITRARCSGSPRGAPFWTGKTPAVLLAGLKKGSDRRHAVWNSMVLSMGSEVGELWFQLLKTKEK